MAANTLCINEYSNMGSGWVGPMPPGVALARQSIAITGDSVASAVFNPNTKGIMVMTNAACNITIGPDPTADVDFEPMYANEVRFYGVLQPGWSLAVIAAST